MPDIDPQLCTKCTQYDTRRGGACQFKDSDTHILRPLGNQTAERVKNWRQIKKEAKALREFINKKDFEGRHEDAYAISHVQVSRYPKDFFVVHEKQVKTFGSWCVVNLKIIKKSRECTFKEGCMSFMYRDAKKVDRFATVSVKYYTPFLNLFLIPRWKTFQDLDAFICQHEFDHAQGINIYGI